MEHPVDCKFRPQRPRGPQGTDSSGSGGNTRKVPESRNTPARQYEGVRNIDSQTSASGQKQPVNSLALEGLLTAISGRSYRSPIAQPEDH